ncbi:MAG: ABC transporter substrate-binding protein [Clostridia bacterium]|nr:ABC transporter substrate-binding protein [Clostridia bacterium]
MKKLFALVLAMMMVLSVAMVAYADDPIVVTMWHTRGSGANGDRIKKSVEIFNSTIGAEKGIKVEELYQGGYIPTKSAIMNAIGSKDQDVIPEIVVLERAAGVPDFAVAGQLVDLNPYVEASGIDMSNFQQALLGFSYYNDELIALPYIRSTPVFYYNKTVADELGVQAPVTIDDMIDFGRKMLLVENGEVVRYGVYMPNDPAWFIANMMWQMGSALFNDEGTSIPCLEDGCLLRALKAWREWVDEGWMMIPPASGSTTEMFYQGKIGGMFTSCGSMANILRNADFEVGVTYLPYWEIPSAPTGGGNIALLKDNPKEYIDAAWEFVAFLMSDEQVADDAAMTGYLPSTKTSTETEIIQNLWAEHPQYKVAFDQLENGRELPWCEFKADFEDQMKIICGELIQSRTITAEEAVQKLQEAAEMIYLEYGL